MKQIKITHPDGSIDIIPNLTFDITSKLDKLVSGKNIKTINGEDILGEGDIEIKASDSLYTEDTEKTISAAFNNLNTRLKATVKYYNLFEYAVGDTIGTEGDYTPFLLIYLDEGNNVYVNSSHFIYLEYYRIDCFYHNDEPFYSILLCNNDGTCTYLGGVDTYNILLRNGINTSKTINKIKGFDYLLWLQFIELTFHEQATNALNYTLYLETNNTQEEDSQKEDSQEDAQEEDTITIKSYFNINTPIYIKGIGNYTTDDITLDGDNKTLTLQDVIGDISTVLTNITGEE